MKINIIAPNIKNGGGLELLIYLVKYLEKEHCDLRVVVYVDASLGMIRASENIEVVYMGSTTQKIKLFAKNMNNALYFGNLPPLVKSKNSVVYLHNHYLLMSFSELRRSSFKFFVKYTMQQLYIKIFIKNVDMVACQNKKISSGFVDKYGFENVELLPFFRLCSNRTIESKVYDFCYVSLAHPHKNHEALLNAMEILSDENISVTLALTIEEGHEDLIAKIKKINEKGNVKIDNLGLLSKEDVCKLYERSKCLVFPSTQETFGLGLIEAVSMGLDAITSDLDYVYESIVPSLVFDPSNSKDIAKKLKMYMNGNVKKSETIISNEIEKLIEILVKKNI